MSNDNVFSSSLFSQLYKSREVLISILKTIGYDTSGYDNFTSNEVHSMLNNKQLDMLITNEETNKKIYYKYHLHTKIRPANVLDYIEDIFNIEEVLDLN